MKKLISILTILIISFSCDEKGADLQQPEIDAILQNLTGFDGCGWVIQIKNKSEEVNYLEPINIEEFDIELKDGLSVSVLFEEVNDMASICMVGPIIRITKLEVK